MRSGAGFVKHKPEVDSNLATPVSVRSIHESAQTAAALAKVPEQVLVNVISIDR